MPIEKKCVICGKTFSVPPCREKTASTCSNECAVIVRAKSRERKVVKKCQGCGVLFEVPQSHRNRRTYCSNECRYRSDTAVAALSSRITGDLNPAWKGGETTHSDGYIYKLASEHPFSCNGYVFKHRLVVEKALKAAAPGSKFLIKLGDSLYLSPDYSVHHLDTDIKNNDKTNLIVCSNAVHRKLHAGTMPKKHEYWPNDKETENKLKEFVKNIKQDPVSLPGQEN